MTYDANVGLAARGTADCGCGGGDEALRERVAIRTHEGGEDPTRAWVAARWEYRRQGLCFGCGRAWSDAA